MIILTGEIRLDLLILYLVGLGAGWVLLVVSVTMKTVARHTDCTYKAEDYNKRSEYMGIMGSAFLVSVAIFTIIHFV